MKYDKAIEEFGTPLYIFDIDILKDRLNTLKQKLSDRVALCYAVKANPFIIPYAEPLCERLEVCSEGEFEICERVNAPMDKIVVSGVYKTPAFIERIVDCYDDICVYTIESLTHYELLKGLAKKYSKRLPVLIRITSKNQFGISEKDLDEILRDNPGEYLDVKGLQYFSSTQKNSMKKFRRELAYLSELIGRIEEEYGIKIEEMEYGTGFPVSYFPTESIDEEQLFAEFNEELSVLPADIKITLEIGRSIAASCGSYITSVVDMKENSAGRFAIVDGGINHLVYYGQSMAMKQPVFELFPERECDETQEWNICGSLCTVNDIIVKALPLPKLEIGDMLCFKNTGAYCMCEGISLFLSRELPAVAVIEDNKSKLLRGHFKTSALNGPKTEKEI